MAKKRLGIIQSRGIGDIIIALPIARYYYERDWDVYWPILEEFLPNVVDHVPWVKWIPVARDSGKFFYDIPLERLKNFRCDEILPLYQSLSGHPEFVSRPEFQIYKFDQYKYSVAGVPFLEKWRLKDCVTRDPEAEQKVYERVTQPDRPYAVVHLDGSDFRADFDRSMIPPDWDLVEIDTATTPSVFNWLRVLEKAESIVCVDSVIANMVDQMGVGEDRYWIPRSHIHLTPVLGGDWTVLDPSPEVARKIKIFVSS